MSTAINITSATLALAISIGAIWSLGCQGRVAGIEIGPQACLLGIK